MNVKPVELGVKITTEGVDKLIEKVNKLKLSTNLDADMKKSADKLLLKLNDLKIKLGQQIDLGKINTSKLGLTELQNSIFNFMQKISEGFNSSFDPAALKPFTDAVDIATQRHLESLKEGQRISEEIRQKRSDFNKKEGANIKYRNLGEAQAKKDLWEQQLKDKLTKSGKKTPTTVEEIQLQKRIEKYDDYIKKLKDLQQELSKLEKQQEQQSKKSEKLEGLKLDAEKNLEVEKTRIAESDTGESIPEVKEAQEIRESAFQTVKELTEEESRQIKVKKQLTDEINKEAKATEESNKSFTVRLAKYFSFNLVLQQVKKLVASTIKSITELDKAMTEAAIVTGMNREEAWKLLDSYQTIARRTGLATSEISNIAVEFLKQGRTVADAMKLAEVAAESARVAGISAKDAVDYLTSAVNGFGLAATQAQDIADKFSAIAASSATDFEELAIAMSKVSPTAKSAGVGVDFMMGVIAKGLETTREAPENIGTAFKTIFARMREVTDMGKAAEDGMSLNRVEKALASVDVKLRDTSGQFRNLEDVLMDVGNKWDTLTSIEQAYLATALAGSRQQPRLLAIFNDFARTKELIQISSEASGQLAFQHIEYMGGMEAATAKMKTAWEGVITAFTNSEPIIKAIEIITSGIDMLAKYIESISKGNILSIISIMSVLAVIIIVNAKAISSFGLSLLNLIPSMITWISTTYAAAAGSGVLSAGLAGVAAGVWAILWPILLVIAAAALLVGAFLLISEALMTTEEKVERTAESIIKMNKEIDELTTKQKDIKKLTDRFNELSKKVALSGQEIEELNGIITELSSVEIGNETFKIGYVDFAGVRRVNEAELERFNNYIENQIDETGKTIKQRFEISLKDQGAFETLSNAVLADYAKSIGYKIGTDYISGITDGIKLEGDQIIEANKKLAESLANIDMTKFIKYNVHGLGGKITNSFKTYEDALAYAKTSNEADTASAKSVFDQEEFNTFSERMADIYKNYINSVAVENQNILDRQLEGEEAKLENLNDTLDIYNTAIDEINEKFDDPVQKQIALEVLATSDNAAAILKSLVDGGVSLEIIAKANIAGIDNTQLSEFKNTLTNAGESLISSMTTEQLISYAGQTGYNFNNFRVDLNALRTSLLENVSPLTEKLSVDLINLIGSGFDRTDVSGAFDKVNTYIAQELIDSDSAQIIRTSVYNLLDFADSTEIATKLKDTKDLVANIFSIDKKIIEGDFEAFNEVASTQEGLDAVKAFLGGDASAFSGILEAQKQEQIKLIQDSIDALIAQAGKESNLSDIQKQELERLRLMKQYYQDIVGYELEREAILTNIKKITDSANIFGDIATNLKTLGNTAGANIFESLRKQDIANSIKAYDDAIVAEMSKLEDFGSIINGVFTPNSDDIGEGQASYNRYIGYIQEKIALLTEEYNIQKSIIEDTYKAEISAIKDANNAKWKEIEYTDKLIELQNDLVDTRRKLIGQSLGGISGSELQKTTDELKKLQQERQKLIEQQMVEQATKELEDKMNQEIINITKGNTDATNILTEAIKSLTDSIKAKPIATNYSNDTWLIGTGVK